MPNLVPRITVTVPAEVLRRIQNYQYDTRQNNRTDAVINLINYGLEALQEQEQPAKDSGLSSEDIRIAQTIKELRPDYRRILLAHLEVLQQESRTNPDTQE